MKRLNQISGVAILGTRERGGIRAVIENHIQAGVYDGYEHYLIDSHDEADAARRVRLAFGALLRLSGLILRRKVSLCHLHGSMKGSIYRKAAYTFICRLLGCRVIFHLHGSEFAKTFDRAGGTYRSLVRYLLNRADFVFVLSDYWKDYVGSICANPRIQVINNFPSPVFEDIYDRRTYDTKPTTELLFLGHIGQRKGIYDLVEAVDLLKTRGIGGFRINVGGNGEVEKLKSLIAQRGLEPYFNVIGWVSGEQKHQLIESSDLLLLPSHNEGLPIAILEALSAGLAVLSTRVGGIPDAISEERFGLLVEPGQPQALAAAITRYLDTEGLIESVARNARELYDRDYSSKANVGRIRAVFATLAGT
jgi:glycosyltransferase involved in cell wall biosynthesis